VITALQDNMTSMDYALHIYMHLIESADTVNTRFVWKRAPKGKETSKALMQAWGVSKCIRKSEYGKAFEMLGAPVVEE
jgi:hypothetical protein